MPATERRYEYYGHAARITRKRSGGQVWWTLHIDAPGGPYNAGTFRHEPSQEAIHAAVRHVHETFVLTPNDHNRLF